MELEHVIKIKDISFTMFLDWDKYKNRFYNNLYLDEYKFVIKMPLLTEKKNKDKLKIKKFSLTRYTYLVSYE